MYDAATGSYENMSSQLEPGTAMPFARDLISLERPQSRRTDHFSNIVADREFSTKKVKSTMA